MKSSDAVIDEIITIAKQKNISITQLAKKVGMAKSGVSRYFNKTRPFPLNRTQAFAHALGVNADALINDTNDANIPISATVNVPIIKTIAADTPVFARANINGYLSLPQSFVPNGDNFLLTATGHALEPKIPSGAQVLVHAQTNVKSGEIAAVLLKGMKKITLKYIKRTKNALLLYPLNPKAAVVVPDSAADVRIIGKAIRVFYEL